MIPRCLQKDLKVHSRDYLTQIYHVELSESSGEERSVYWCSECGAVVVDQEFDGRRFASTVPMKFPKTLKELLENKSLS